MTRWRSPGGHRRTVKASKGDPGKVREMRARRAAEKDSCRFPDPRCGCVSCDPES
jgi:hypothetical protein